MAVIFEIGINIRETHTRTHACTHMHAQWPKTVDNGHRIILGLRRAVISDYVVRIRKKAFNSSLSKLPSNIISPYIVRIFPTAFQLNNFTVDEFSFQLVFFTENWKVLPSILMTSFGWKTLPKHPFHCKFGIRSDSRLQG